MNEDSKIWRDKYFIHWHETDLKGLVTPVTLCNYLGESAGRSASNLGFGYNDAVRLNQFWVILRWCIKMEKYPAWKDEIIMETWPRMPEHLYAYRDYAIKTLDGELLGAATSTWMVLDAKTRRPQKLELVQGLLHHTLDKKSFDENARKVNIPDDLENVGKVKATYSDMDFHGHVTNSKYVEWCLDLFSQDFHKKYVLSELQINFLHECHFGDTLDLKMKKVDELNHVVIATHTETGKNIFAAELSWRLL